MRKAAYLQITRKCNNRCIFCSNPEFESEPGYNSLVKQINNLKKEGINEIILTGGEPTISEHLTDILKYIKEVGLNVRMISNGVNLSDQEFVKALNNIKHIHISIHHFKNEIADYLSQRAGHLEKSLTGIKNCLKEGKKVDINSTINSKNCKDLPAFMEFMISNFPKIQHYVFNALDPGDADGKIQSRAAKNPEIVAKFSDFELELAKMVEILKKNNKSFRIERVPLCYMKGFEEFSTETRKIVKEEKYYCSFLREGQGHDLRVVSPSSRRIKTRACEFCSVEPLCAGVQKEYALIHGLKELHPSFENSQRIIRSIK
ncbi:MAG: radical SAM protein [Candidatus Nanoarchaeia archaeon]